MQRTSHSTGFCLLLLLLFISDDLNAMAALSLEEVFQDFHPTKSALTRTQKKQLLEGAVMADAQVKDAQDEDQKLQSLSFTNAGLHSQKCQLVLKKLSHYENYKNWVGFIKESQFDDNKNLLSFHVDHSLLPTPMLVDINIKRVNSLGIYDFTLPTGIFKGLSGKVLITEYQSRCLLLAYGTWVGPHTGLPNKVIEFFTQGLTKIAGNLLLRKTRF